MRIVKLAAIVFTALSRLVTGTHADEPRASSAVGQSPAVIHWGSAGVKVSGELRKRDLLQWSDELAGKLAGADAETLQIAVEVFRRAGQPQRMSQAILGLSRSALAGRQGDDWELVTRMLELGWHEQACAWFDTFAGQCPSPADMRGFVQWLVEKEGAAGAEQWLGDKARRGQRWSNRWALCYPPFGRLYWGHLAASGKLEAYARGLAESIKRTPADADLVFEYLGARSQLPRQQQVPLTWLAETCRLERALHNFALGQMFRRDDPPEAAILFYDRSLACPVTDYDRRHFNEFSNWSMYVAPEGAEKHLRGAAKAGLAEACFRAKKLDRAQKLVEELTGKKNGTLADLGPFQLAGQVQAASGQRVVEGRIKTAEGENKGSIRYWLNRAKYYCGRTELTKAEEAYQAALKLPADPADTQHFEAVRDYGWFLVQQKRLADADRVFREELKRIGPQDPKASFWLNQLQYQVNGKGGPTLKWDEPIVWDYLAGQKTFFGDDAQRRFEWAAAKAGKEVAESREFERRARALAADPCPPRLQFFLGAFLRGHGATQEGARMMAEAYERSSRKEWPGDPRGTEEMLRLHLSRNDLGGAEKMLNRLLDELPYGSNPRWLGECAALTAGNRAPELAMRLWRVKANLDLTDQAGLETLVSHGLADRLRDFYAGLAKRAPDNVFVAAALKKLPAETRPGNSGANRTFREEPSPEAREQAASAKGVSVRRRLQRAIDVSRTLAAKGQQIKDDSLRSLGLEAREKTDRDQPLLFPRTEDVEAYGRARPWASNYAPHPALLRPMRPDAGDVEPWPTPADAPELRALLEDKDPAMRCVAAEALATLHQPEDVRQIGRLLKDDAGGLPALGWNTLRTARPVQEEEIVAGGLHRMRSWHDRTVATTARLALKLMTGVDLTAKDFDKWWQRNSGGRNCVWYWQQRLTRDLAAAEMTEFPPWQGNAVETYEAWSNRCLARQHQRFDVVRQAVAVELAQLAAEIEAKVRLAAINRYSTSIGAGLDEPLMGPFVCPRIGTDRLLELLDRKNLWEDVDWKDPAYYNNLVAQVVGRAELFFRPEHLPRLRAIMDREYGGLWWSGRVAFLVGISHLLPPAKAATLDYPDTRDGWLRRKMQGEGDVTVRGCLATELVRFGLPRNWQFLEKEFFAEAGRKDRTDVRQSILRALGAPPLTPAKREALLEVVLDERFAPLWTQPNRYMGDDMYRQYAIWSLNAHAGKELLTDHDKNALTDPSTSEKALAEVRRKVATLRQEKNPEKPAREAVENHP